MAAVTGLPGADRRHMPDLWTDLLAAWRDHGLPARGAPVPPPSRHPVAPPPPLPETETQRRHP
jgi:hypothetical protein